MTGDGEATRQAAPAGEGGPPRPTPKDDGSERARALALLEATHEFPCDYALTVIAFNLELVTTAVKAAVTHGGAEVEHKTLESKAGKYLSHRFAVKVTGPVHVLDIYARLRSLEGVVTLL